MKPSQKSHSFLCVDLTVCDGAGGCRVGDSGVFTFYSAQVEELPERLFGAVKVCLVEMSAATVVDRVVRERLRSAFVERFWD
ncbi:hypothetical protein RHMOL_Rhmol01G0296700 [Rhododendron molle]|uniref:Uncharacterized protein n=1 Tax=Rhododendron molle TaxID=49168 RepID=A0ACC0Q8J8_RHOML|nr:hypothetical protein RHMOL_Rhmol01G0296700 [Rhododendron molle]